MEKTNKILELDSRNYGFAIRVSGNVKTTLKRTSEFLAGKDNRPILYNNVQIALLSVKMKYYLSPKDVSIKLIKYESDKNRIIILCDYNDMFDCGNGLLQFISKDKIYFVKQTHIDSVLDIRYVVFEDGDNNRTEKEYGHKRQKQLFHMLKNAAVSAFKYSGIIDGIHVQAEEIIISLKNSSAKIHMCSNGNIARYNTARKEQDGVMPPQFTRCIPYDKVMDKYTTIYCYTAKDNSEPSDFGFSGDIMKDVEYIFGEILEYLKGEEQYNENLKPKYSKVEFKGVILTKNR